MSNVSPQFRLLGELLQIRDEKRFRNLIANCFYKRLGLLTYLTHGIIEKGVDVVMVYDKNLDLLLRGQLFLIQVKRGNINTTTWRNSLHSQLMELSYAQVNISPYDSNEVSRRIILITTGVINGHVKERISDLNKKQLIPIEYLEGANFVEILIKAGYQIQEIREDLDDETYIKSPQ